MSQFPFHPGKIFVFGSNLAGIHGAGAAKEALENYGAEWKIGMGRRSMSYAIPTKGHKMEILSLVQINYGVAKFLLYATQVKEQFFITPIGTGLAGYSHAQIAPMFRLAPSNCELPEEWKGLLK